MVSTYAARPSRLGDPQTDGFYLFSDGAFEAQGTLSTVTDASRMWTGDCDNLSRQLISLMHARIRGRLKKNRLSLRLYHGVRNLPQLVTLKREWTNRLGKRKCGTQPCPVKSRAHWAQTQRKHAQSWRRERPGLRGFGETFRSVGRQGSHFILL